MATYTLRSVALDCGLEASVVRILWQVYENKNLDAAGIVDTLRKFVRAKLRVMDARLREQLEHCTDERDARVTYAVMKQLPPLFSDDYYRDMAGMWYEIDIGLGASSSVDFNLCELFRVKLQQFENKYVHGINEDTYFPKETGVWKKVTLPNGRRIHTISMASFDDTIPQIPDD